MSLSQIQDLLQEEGWQITPISKGTFSVEMVSNSTDFQFSTLFHKIERDNEDMEIRLTLPKVEPLQLDPEALCIQLKLAEPRIDFSFNRKEGVFKIAHSIYSGNFTWIMASLLNLADHFTQILVSEAKGERKAELADLMLAVRLVQGTS